MRDKKKWLVHIIIGFALFRLGLFFLDFLSRFLFSISSVLDVVITIPLLVILALFAWFFGGWLAGEKAVRLTEENLPFSQYAVLL